MDNLVRKRARAPRIIEAEASAVTVPFRPKWSDFLAIVINAVIGLLGLVLLPSKPDVGIVTASFFGTGAVFLGWLQWERYSDHKLALTSVEVAGGVRIYPRRAFMVGMGVWMAALGLVMLVFGAVFSVVFQGIAAFIAFVGVVLTVAAMFRLYPAGFLQFEPDGLIIGQRGWQILIPWDAIYGVVQSEIQSNPIIRLGIEDPLAVVVSPASAQAKADKAMNGGTLTNWGPFIIFPMHYGIPSSVLAGAIMQYAKNAAARRGLGTKRLQG